MLSGSHLSIQMFDLSLGDHSVVLPAPKNAKWFISKSSQILKILRFAWLLSLIPFSFPESIEILPSSITSPKYSTFVWLNSHLVSFRNRSLSCKCVRIFLVFSVNVFSSGAKRKILSMYMITMWSLIISPKMSSIIAWNVAGELHIPNNITVGSKSPLFILKATFHWSPSLILTLLYPH